MTPRQLLFSSLLVGALAAGWFAWRWHTTPAPPEISLDGVDAAIAEPVQQALTEVHRQPRSGEAWGQLGMVLAANGFYEHVPRCFVEAERLDPTKADWPYLHGMYLLQVNPNQAIPLFRKALSLTSIPQELAAIHMRLALIYIESGELEQADAEGQALGKLDPHGPRLRFVHALMSLARGDRAAARAHLTRPHRGPFHQEAGVHSPGLAGRTGAGPHPSGTGSANAH